MKAILKSDFTKSSVKDGVISGVRLMEVNRTAHFKGADGKPKSIEITPELISGLLAHAGNRSIPSHLSHDHFNADTDAIHARLGSVKNIRVDEAGNMVGDLHTMPNENGKLALWLAENDPENAAMSAIFDYNAILKDGKTFAHPLNFQTADLVAAGAACSAMFSQHQSEYTMLSPEDKQEIADLIKTGVTAQLKEYRPELPASITKDDVASIVTAALANHKATLSDDEKKSVALLAKAELTTEIGRLGLVASTGGNGVTEHAFLSKVKANEATGANKDVAFLRAQKDHADLYNDYMKQRAIFKAA